MSTMANAPAPSPVTTPMKDPATTPPKKGITAAKEEGSAMAKIVAGQREGAPVSTRVI